MPIPVTFDYNGKTFTGTLNKVSGAGSTAHYHLLENGNRYAGQLFYSQHEKYWLFASQKGYNDEIAKILVGFIKQN